MPSTITVLVLALVVFLVSYLLTGAVIRVAPKVGLTCKPSHRGSHTTTMPHGGGIGFVIPFFILVSLLLYFSHMSIHSWLVIVGCGGLIFVVGLWDDISDTPVILRLLVQFACVGIGVWLLSRVYGGYADGQLLEIGLFGYLISVLVIIWWLNLFNFMDGIDGLAGGEAVFIALGAILMLWLKGWVLPVEMSRQIITIELQLGFLSVSVLGFLVHNWAPAKVFMGDTGSTFLGFTLGMIALSSTILGALPISIWLILGAVFWVDATFTLMRRILLGKRWYLAHKSHAYQHAISLIKNIDETYDSKIIKRLFTTEERHAHKLVCSSILAINICWLLPLSSLVVILPEFELLMVLLAWSPLIWIAHSLGAGQEDVF